MNCVNVAYLFGVLCLLISPSLTAPADSETGSPETLAKEPNPAKNDVGSEFDDGVESFNPDTESVEKPTVSTDGTKPTVSGGSTGVVTRTHTNGTLTCHHFTCPEGTLTCKFSSTLSPDGKTSNFEYKCYSSNNDLLLETSKVEPAEDFGFFSIDFDSFFGDFRREMSSFFDNLFGNFQM